MGWKGTVRSINASLRAMERDAQRRQRELARQQKEAHKLEERERAAYEVAVYENRIDVLLSVHKEAGEEVDWQGIADARPPKPPTRQSGRERKAQVALERFKPGMVARLLGSEAKKRAALESAVAEARAADEAEYQDALRAHEAESADWVHSKELAVRVVAHEPAALLQALTEMNPFADISTLGSSLTFQIDDGGVLESTVHVHGQDVIPREVLGLLKSGKLSTKQMAKGKYNELHQDYVCSCVLRVAREVFALLPVDTVIVTACDELLDTTTGHMAETPIVSVAAQRRTMSRLNLDAIDPSDSMSNFLHRMAFKKSTGFSGVERLRPSDVPAT